MMYVILCKQKKFKTFNFLSSLETYDNIKTVWL